ARIESQMEQARALPEFLQSGRGLAQVMQKLLAGNARQAVSPALLIPIQERLLRGIKHQVNPAGGTAKDVQFRQRRMAKLLETGGQGCTLVPQGIEDLGQASPAIRRLHVPDVAQRIGGQTFEKLVPRNRVPAWYFAAALFADQVGRLIREGAHQNSGFLRAGILEKSRHLLGRGE